MKSVSTVGQKTAKHATVKHVDRGPRPDAAYSWIQVANRFVEASGPGRAVAKALGKAQREVVALVALMGMRPDDKSAGRVRAPDWGPIGSWSDDRKTLKKPLRRRRVSTLTTLALVGTLVSAPVLPHGGGLNSAGCHNDYVNGGYHCHRGGDDGTSIDSDAVLAALLVGGVAYMICKLRKKRPQKANSVSGLPLNRVLDVPSRDPVKLGLFPVTNGRGRVDGVGFQLSFRF